MWTPRRILLLLATMAITTGAYFVYARVLGGIDGLPELPAEYLVEPNAPAPPTPSEKGLLTKEMLRRAFGGASPEVGNAIAYKLQFYKVDSGTLIACGQPAFAATAEPSRFVEVSPFSLAFIGKPRGPGEVGPPDEREEITTVHADKAILEFDRPVASTQDMANKCKMVGLQMQSTPDVLSADARSGKVWVTNNQKSADPGQFLVFNTVGPVYYRSPDDGPTAGPDVPQMYSNAAVEVIDKRNLPRPLRSSSTATSRVKPDDLRGTAAVAAILLGDANPPPTITAEGMKIYLDRSTGKEPPAGAKADKRNTTGYSSVRLVELSRDVQFNLWTDGGSGFPGTTPVADAPPAPKDAAPPIDPPAALGAVAGAFADVAPIAKMFRDKKLLVIDTPGSFRFDFAKSLARFESDGLESTKTVSVHRVSAYTEPDELFCKLLVVQFDGAGGEKAAAPAAGVGSGMKIKSLSATGPHVFVSVDAEQLLAQGQELKYTVDAANRTTVTTLSGETVSAVREKNSLNAGRLPGPGRPGQPGQIQITSIDPPAGGKENKKTVLQVNGPGQIDIFDAATGATTVQATWGRSLTQERVRVGTQDQDLLKFDGNAEFLDTKAQMRLGATRLLLWLGSREEPAGAPVAPAKSANIGQAVPQRLDAIGNVAMKSPELVIRDTDLLKLWFRDVATPVVKVRVASATAAGVPQTPLVVAGTPPFVATPQFKPADGATAVASADAPPAAAPPKPKPPIELTARTVESWLVRYPQPADMPKPVAAAAVAPAPGLKYEMERALCEDRVVVHQDPAEPEKVPRGLDIAGVKLNLVASRVNDEVGQVMTVTGTPGAFAEVHFETTSLFGPVIKIDQINNTVAIDGIGSLLMPSNTDFSGAVTDRANELEIRFVKSMFFNGAKGTAEFLGLVNAVQRPARDALSPKPVVAARLAVPVGTAPPAPADDGAWTKSQLLCHRLDVTFDRPIYFNQFRRDEAAAARDPNDSPKMRKADCTPLPDDELAGNTNPLARKVSFLEENYTKDNVPLKFQLIEGRQIEVRLRDKEKTQEMFATGPGQVRILQPDSSEFGKKPAGPTPARKPGERAPFKLTLVKYLDTMTALDKNKLYQTATFRNGANVWQIPTNNINLAFAAHDAPPGTTSLSCSTSLEVSASRPRPDAEAVQEMVAVGNAEFTNQDYTGHGAQINFLAKDITLQGSSQRLASIYPNKRSVNQQEGTRAKKIVYRADGTIEAPEAGTGTFVP